MRRFLMLIAATLAVVGVIASSAPKSEAACFTVRCFNKQIRKLKSQVRVLRAEVFGCERLLPISQYYGYEYGGADQLTTALDVTESGDPVDTYVVVDACRGGQSASAAAGDAIGHLRILRDLGEPQQK
jgi:hypothetical protein